MNGNLPLVNILTLPSNYVNQTDSNGNTVTSDITSTELSYLDGVTSNLQDQIDNASGQSFRGVTISTSYSIFLIVSVFLSIF